MDLALADRVHDNLMQVNRVAGEAPGGELHEAPGELFFASASTMPFLNDAHRPARLATGAKPQQRSSRPRLEGDASVDRQGALDHMQGEETILLELTQLPPRSRRARVRPVRDGPRAGVTASRGASSSCSAATVFVCHVASLNGSVT